MAYECNERNKKKHRIVPSSQYAEGEYSVGGQQVKVGGLRKKARGRYSEADDSIGGQAVKIRLRP